MDPNENLKLQREIAARIIELADRPASVASLEATDAPSHAAVQSAMASLGAELAEHVQALDEWRTKGGFDPYPPPNQQYVVLAVDHGMWRDPSTFGPFPTEDHARRFIARQWPSMSEGDWADSNGMQYEDGENEAMVLYVARPDEHTISDEENFDARR